MSVVQEVTVTWSCDGPACTETAASPVDWVCTSVQGSTEGAVATKFDGKHFHNEACLVAHINS